MQKLSTKNGAAQTGRALSTLSRRLRRVPRAAHLVPALVAAQQSLEQATAHYETRLQERIDATDEATHEQAAVGEAVRAVDTTWNAITNRKRDDRTTALFPDGASALSGARRSVLRSGGRELVARILGDPTYAGLTEQAQALETALDRFDLALAAQQQAADAVDRAQVALRAVLEKAKRTYNATVNQVVVVTEGEPGLAERLVPQVRSRRKTAAAEPEAAAEAEEKAEDATEAGEVYG